MQKKKKQFLNQFLLKKDKKGIDSLFDQVLDAYIGKKEASVGLSGEDKEKSIVIKKDKKNIKKGQKRKCCSN